MINVSIPAKLEIPDGFKLLDTAQKNRQWIPGAMHLRGGDWVQYDSSSRLFPGSGATAYPGRVIVVPDILPDSIPGFVTLLPHQKWHRYTGWKSEALGGLYRPLIVGEKGSYEKSYDCVNWTVGTAEHIPTNTCGTPTIFFRTSRPLPNGEADRQPIDVLGELSLPIRDYIAKHLPPGYAVLIDRDQCGLMSDNPADGDQRISAKMPDSGSKFERLMTVPTPTTTPTLITRSKVKTDKGCGGI